MERKEAGWDVGEMPTVRMAYLEYPTYTPRELSQRDQENTRAFVTDAEMLKREKRRMQVRSETGWASSRRGAYKPLGAPDLTLPLTGDELRRSKEAEAAAVRPKVVNPDERKKANRAQKEDEIEQLELGQPIRSSVRQFNYVYYKVPLRVRANLRITVTCLSGDPDVFVANDTTAPTIDDHVWRSGGKGDDVVDVETSHPRYTLGQYYIGIYAICDSEFEVRATLSEVQIGESMKLVDNTTGNGFGTLSQLVSQAEERRRLCSFGARAEVKPAPRDAATLYQSLPMHLKAEFSLADGTSEPPPGTGTGTSGRRASSEETCACGTHDQASFRSAVDPSASFRSALFGDPPDQNGSELPAALSILTTPYLASAYFGSELTPRLGGPKKDAAAAAAPTPPAAERSLLASHLSTRAPTPRPLLPAAPLHPWLPGAAEPSVAMGVDVATARTSAHLKPLVMQMRHSAMKEDMDVQMRRVARAVDAERGLISQFKVVALEEALRATHHKMVRGQGLPLAEHPTDSLRSLRMHADGMRTATLRQLRRAAEAGEALEETPLVFTSRKSTPRTVLNSARSQPSAPVAHQRNATDATLRSSDQAGSRLPTTQRAASLRLSTMYPIHLPQLQPGSSGRRAIGVAAVAAAIDAPAEADSPISAMFEVVVPPPIESVLNAFPPESSMPAGRTPRARSITGLQR